MARVQNPLIGKASGSVGGATFSTWKGIQVLKSKPESVANPNTIGQQKQRNKMRVAVAMYRLIAVIIAFGFKQQAVAKSAYNAFVSEALSDALVTDANGVVTVNYPDLLVSKGTVGKTVTNLEDVTGGEDEIEVQWDSANIPPGGSASDRLLFAVYNETQDEWFTNSNAAQRSNANAPVANIPNINIGDRLHVYTAFYNAQEGTSSDSYYEFTTAIA